MIQIDVKLTNVTRTTTPLGRHTQATTRPPRSASSTAYLPRPTRLPTMATSCKTSPSPTRTPQRQRSSATTSPSPQSMPLAVAPPPAKPARPSSTSALRRSATSITCGSANPHAHLRAPSCFCHFLPRARPHATPHATPPLTPT